MIPLTIKASTDKIETALSNLAKSLGKADIKKIVIFIASRVLERVIEKTPVDTGRARMGWSKAFRTLQRNKYSFLKGQILFSIGKSKKNTFKIRDKKTGKLVTEEFDNRTGKMEPLRTGDITIKDGPRSFSITIYNDVVYISELETGYSAQAPFGMLRISLLELMDEVPGGILRLYQTLWESIGKSGNVTPTTFRIERNDLYKAFGDLRSTPFA